MQRVQVQDFRYFHDLEEIVPRSSFSSSAHLTAHGIGVDLAHVSTGIVLLNVRHVQLPRVVSVVRDGQPVIVRHHVRVYRQDRSGIRLYPGYLEHPTEGVDVISRDNTGGNCG